MMKKRFMHQLLIAACAMSACDNDDLNPAPSEYSWTISQLSPNNNFIIFDLKIGVDGQLYATGVTDDQFAFARLLNNEWQWLAQVNEIGISDFTYYYDTIYYTANSSLKRAKDLFVETIMSGPFGSVEVFGNKLIISGGEPIPVNDGEYTIFAYETGGEFIPIDSGIQSGAIKNLNGKLFIEGHPLKIYDGLTVTGTEFYGGLLNVDASEAIYSWRQMSSSFIVNKFIDSEYHDVGNTIQSRVAVNALEFDDETMVVSGIDSNKNLSESFYLNDDNRWVGIPTAHYILDLINFNGKIFAATVEGELLEFTLT